MKKTNHQDLKLFKQLPWLTESSVYSLPVKGKAPAEQDAFLIGGGGYLLARMGMQNEYSAMDRIVGPYYDNYTSRENNHFQMDIGYPYCETGGRFIKEKQSLYRVSKTAFVISCEKFDALVFYTINFVHPRLNTIFRIAVVKNLERELPLMHIAFDTRPDVVRCSTGFNSRITKLNNSAVIETVTEYKFDNPFGSHNLTDKFDRERFMVRGIIDGKVKGIQDFNYELGTLQPGDERYAIHYLAVSTKGTQADAVANAGKVQKEIKTKGIINIMQEVKEWWDAWNATVTQIHGAGLKIEDALDSAAVLNKIVEQHTGGFSVIDTYSHCFVRDSCGPHLHFLRLGQFASVRKSMDYFFKLDVLSENFQNSYVLDYPVDNSKIERPYWFEKARLKPPDKKALCASNSADRMYFRFLDKDRKSLYGRVWHMTPGDCPNFKVLWYWWYYRYTGDINLIKERFRYLKAQIDFQEIEHFDYLAGFSHDETYGLGRIGLKRNGRSLDNSFVLSAACHALAEMAKAVNSKEGEKYSAMAQKIDKSIEKLWLKKKGHYAMRLDENKKLDPLPCSPGFITPLWVGARDENDKHVARSIDYVLSKMYKKPGYLELAPGMSVTIGHVLGYLLKSLCVLDHPKTDDVFKDIFLYFCASGTCGEYYTYDSECPKVGAHRVRCWETGLNADAILYYFTGFEPDAPAHKITIKPRLPAGQTRLKCSHMKMADVSINMAYSRKGEKHSVKISHDGDKDLTVDLTLLTDNIKFRCQGGRILNHRQTKNQWGISKITIEFVVSAGKSVAIKV